jgi:hypothetical protein
MSQFDMDKVTSMALAEFERTDVGITLISWMQALVEERKERLAGHRGIASIPDIWHDQGFVEGVRSVMHIFEHAKTMQNVWTDEDGNVTSVDLPEPSYLGANPEDPRR